MLLPPFQRYFKLPSFRVAEDVDDVNDGDVLVFCSFCCVRSSLGLRPSKYILCVLLFLPQNVVLRGPSGSINSQGLRLLILLSVSVCTPAAKISLRLMRLYDIFQGSSLFVTVQSA